MKTIKYKLTSQKLQTHNGFQWKTGHCYDSPLIAVFHNPIHENIKNPRLFEVECSGEAKNDKGLKCGYTKMRIIKEIPLPDIKTEQIIKYGILCAIEVYKGATFIKWSKNWLSGRDRTAHAAEAAHIAAYAVYAAAYEAYAAEAAVYAAHAAEAARTVADEATHAAVHAVYAAAYAAHAAEAAAYEAYAAEAAVYAAHAAEAARTVAEATAHEINLVSIAKEAIG